MMNKLTSILLALTLLLCLSLTACGGDAESTDSADDSANSAEADPNEGLGGDVAGLSEDDYTIFQGFWLSTEDQRDTLDIEADGDWTLTSCGEVVDEGLLWYIPEEGYTRFEATYYSDELDGYAEVDGDQLSISTLGDFFYFSRSISEFEGIWYLDGDPSSEFRLEIDSWGDWECYLCTSEDDEGELLDSGSLTYDMEDGGFYCASSDYFDDVTYIVYDLSDGGLVWGDEGTFYWAHEW